MSKINREKFEAWMTAEQAFHGSDFEWDERRNCYSQFGIHIAYKAFQSASRESEAQLTALTSQLESVVAENVALKESRKNLAEFIHEELDAGYPLSMNIETPATAAFLAEVRASGVDAAIEHLINKFEGTGHIGVPVMALEWLAKELRQGCAA